MKRILTILSVFLMLLPISAIALQTQSTVNPLIPVNGQPITAPPIQQNFLHVYNDTNTIFSWFPINLNNQQFVTGNLNIINFNGGIGANSGTCWKGNGVWGSCTVNASGGNGYIQYNSGNAFASDSGFTRNPSTFVTNISGAGLTLGTPTGGDLGEGFLNVAGGLSINNVPVNSGTPTITLSGDTTGVGTTAITTTTGKVHGVTYPASPSANTVPVITSATSGGTVTYEAVPNAALANSSITIAGHSVSLGGTQTIACGDLSNSGTACTATTGTSGTTVPFLNGANTWSGIQSFNSGDHVLNGASSGALTINAAAAAGTHTLTFPAGTTDFSATGGTSQVVKQTSSGGAFTVARLACADLSDSGTGCTGSGGTGGAVTLGTSASVANPSIPGDLTSGLMSDGVGLTEVVASGTKQITIGTQGIFLNGATGSAEGTGTLNATNLFKNGTAVLTGNQTITLSGDTTGSGATSIATTLATVNSNVGSFTNANITVNGKGLVTAAANGSSGGSTVIAIGTTTITGGTSTKVLFDNSGVAGEYTISGSGNVAMTTNSTFTTPALGTPSALVLTNATGTPSAITLTNGTGLPIGGLVNIGSNTMLGNWGATSGAVAANVIPSCAADGVHGLTYTNGTGVLCTSITGTGSGITALTGDVTASGTGSVAATLATINTNVGSFTGANITVNGKGLVTAAANGSPTYIITRVTTDISVANTTLANATALSTTLANSTLYTFELWIQTTSASAGGMKMDLGGGTVSLTGGGSLAYTCMLVFGGGASTQNSAPITSLTTLIDWGTGATNNTIFCQGSITPGSSGGGTFIPRFAESASSGTATIWKVGTNMKIFP